MPRLTLDITMSLDGFIAGPNQTLEEPLGAGGERLHEWALVARAWREAHGMEGGETNVDNEVVEDGLAGVGATVMGRRMFSGGEGPWEDDPNADAWWGDNPPFHHPVFVLTHHARERVQKEGGTTFTFVTDGIESALEQARAAAGDRDVAVAGGADVVQQYLEAGLLDEIQVHVVPLLLGDGVRLFDGRLPDGPRALECTRVIESPTGVTHLSYQVRELSAVLLDGKKAVIYGGGGSIGGAVARAFAREGARVHLAGRTLESLEQVAQEIRAAGGVAETAQLDALDERAVDEHADAVAAEAGGIDVSFNVISHPSAHGSPLAEMALEDFTREVMTAVTTTFLTARAAVRHMIRQRSGVILMFGGTGDPIRDYYIGGTQVALGAIDLMRRQLAAELGPHGIRVVTLRSGGVPESLPESVEGREEIIERTIVSQTMLGRAATLEDVGNVAAFVASDRARAMTGATANVSCGALVD